MQIWVQPLLGLCLILRRLRRCPLLGFFRRFWTVTSTVCHDSTAFQTVRSRSCRLQLCRRSSVILWSVARSSTICDDYFMEEIENHFASSVRFHRKRLGMSQEAFAQKAGIHRTYASSIERGRVQVSIGVASKLAEALEIPLSKLIRDMELFAKGKLTDEADT